MLDFDGDECNLSLIRDTQSITETSIVSGIDQFLVSYQSSAPTLGLYQDSIIGASEFSNSKIDKIDKFHAMAMCNRTSGPLKFDKKTYTSREIISKFLPNINYESTAKFYSPDFAAYVDYKDTDTKVKIMNQELISGVLDKATVGATSGSVFHIINNEHGPSVALECMYNLQQVINMFLFYHGVTFGLRDVYLRPKARDELGEATAKIITASEDVTTQLLAGRLVPPVGVTLKDYYEQLQMAALTHGDEFLKPIIADIDTDRNWLYKFATSGSKGDKSNWMALMAALGSIGYRGDRMPLTLHGRTTINFQRFSTDPMSRGYCPYSFSSGLTPLVYVFACIQARNELIEIALGTAFAGTMNRNAVKNLESIAVSNMRGSIKDNRVVQLLFGDTGFDPRYVEVVKFPTIKSSTKDFEAQYRTRAHDLGKRWRHKEVTEALDEEWQQLCADRKEYRRIMFTLERHSRRAFIMKDSVRMPIHATRALQSIDTLSRANGYKRSELDPISAVETVHAFARGIGYAFTNRFHRESGERIAPYIEAATTWLQILIRSTLCVAELRRSGIDNLLLGQICARIELRMTESFIAYGTNVGVIGSESVSEPITQYLIDAKHRSGITTAKTNWIVRFDEILKNYATDNMDNPQMTLVLRPEYSADRAQVAEIANHIEMLTLDRFVRRVDIFAEEFGRPVHPDYTAEAKIIRRFQAGNLGDNVPPDLVPWCIRFELDREEMVLKNVIIKTIYMRLLERFGYMYIVYWDNILRIYIRNSAFKKGSDITLNNINDRVWELRETVVRGTQGVGSTRVIGIPQTREAADGSLELTKAWAIDTDGTNLSMILENPYLNPYECNTTSISEIEAMYGIEAARNKLVEQLLTTANHRANVEWVALYADEMCCAGRTTSIQRSGLGQREINNILLRASTGSPIQVLQSAAINSQVNPITGMSASLCMGTVPKFGTTYNDVCIDTAAVAALTTSDADLIAAI